MSDTNVVKKNKGFEKMAYGSYIPSTELAEVIGAEVMTRGEATKRIWIYIKLNNLQDSEDKRVIVCDENLRKIFRSDHVNMFALTSLLSCHLVPQDKNDIKPEHLGDKLLERFNHFHAKHQDSHLPKKSR